MFRAEVDGGDRALRFYTRDEDPDTRKRYAMLGQTLSEASLGPHVATASWLDKAITVRQQSWPMVEMQWVDGRTLDAYVNYLAGDGRADALGVLAREWRSLIGTLQGAHFAHGDLQHGNVLIDSKTKFRLVEFDGSWIETSTACDRPPRPDTRTTSAETARGGAGRPPFPVSWCTPRCSACPATPIARRRT